VKRALLALLLLVLAGCGRTTEVREPDLVVRGNDAVSERATPDAQSGRGLRISQIRIVVVTHGQASDPFWAVVKKGADDAGREAGVAVSYRAPDTFSLDTMKRFIDEAVEDRPDGLVVSLPDVAALRAPIKAAEAAGIPVVTINSGSDKFKSLGVMAHVGEPEYEAGYQAGLRMGGVGVKHALCVNQESGNAGLDVRCRAFAAGLAKRGGTSQVVPIPLQNAAESQKRLAHELAGGTVDGILTLGPGGAGPAMAAVRAGGLQARVKLATFDLSAEVLEAVRDGKMLFAVDQQPYLQGYLPVMLLSELARHGVFPAQGDLIPTGPHFITKANAAAAVRQQREGVR
jgi:simple sugar transport system substrate-binding protein